MVSDGASNIPKISFHIWAQGSPQAQGTGVKKKDLVQFFNFLTTICPWFLKEGTIDEKTWHRVGECFQDYYRVLGLENIPFSAFSFLTWFRASSKQLHSGQNYQRGKALLKTPHPGPCCDHNTFSWGKTLTYSLWPFQSFLGDNQYGEWSPRGETSLRQYCSAHKIIWSHSSLQKGDQMISLPGRRLTSKKRRPIMSQTDILNCPELPPLLMTLPYNCPLPPTDFPPVVLHPPYTALNGIIEPLVHLPHWEGLPQN